MWPNSSSDADARLVLKNRTGAGAWSSEFFDAVDFVPKEAAGSGTGKKKEFHRGSRGLCRLLCLNE